MIHKLLSILFPRRCHVCGRILVAQEDLLCVGCSLELPHNYSIEMAHNPIEELFMGRIPVVSAGALLTFRAETISQHIVHRIKYSGDLRLAKMMGTMIGHQLARSNRFDDCDMLLPVPLHKKKQRKRGYNQSEELCKGIATVFNRPIDTTSVQRTRNTSSQTHHSRIERVENMANVFAVIQPDALTGRHVLVVDDVVTTGATIESCCKAILQVPGTTVSIVTLASASKA
ncbi:MAG: ComF family protein [Bacteroidales bacterium]|nr:ComF family protein [Bacteroidales bacterium]